MNNEIKVVDYEGESPLPEIKHIFAGRLISSEYVQLDDGKEKKSLHKVHVDLILDSNQYIALLQSMEKGEEIGALLMP